MTPRALVLGLLDLLAPVRCPGCDEALDPDPNDLPPIDPFTDGFCVVCAALVEPFEGEQALYQYGGPLAEAIKRFKYEGRLDALPALTEPSRLARLPKDLPIYLFAGSEDPVGDRGAGVRRLHGSYRAAGMRNTRCTIYPGARHETLNETNREQVMSDLLEWCEQALQVTGKAA